MNHEHFTHDGLNFHYLALPGNGQPLHFYHANGFCAGAYLPFIQLLRDDFPVYALDARGHGKSDNPPNIRDWETLGDDLVALLRHLDVGPVVGAGHSLGAVATLMAAARRPELFTRLILIDPTFFSPLPLMALTLLQMTGLTRFFPLARGARRRRTVWPSRQAMFDAFKGRSIFRGWQDEALRGYVTHGTRLREDGTAELRCRPEVEAQIFERPPIRTWRYLRRLRVPTLVIQGAGTDSALSAGHHLATRKSSWVRLETVEDANHFVVMQRPEVVRNLVVRFCAEEW